MKLRSTAVAATTALGVVLGAAAPAEAVLSAFNQCGADGVQALYQGSPHHAALFVNVQADGFYPASPSSWVMPDITSGRVKVAWPGGSLNLAVPPTPKPLMGPAYWATSPSDQIRIGSNASVRMSGWIDTTRGRCVLPTATGNVSTP